MRLSRNGFVSMHRRSCRSQNEPEGLCRNEKASCPSVNCFRFILLALLTLRGIRNPHILHGAGFRGLVERNQRFSAIQSGCREGEARPRRSGRYGTGVALKQSIDRRNLSREKACEESLPIRKISRNCQAIRASCLSVRRCVQFRWDGSSWTRLAEKCPETAFGII
jgi:hypothetical protein